MDDKDLVEMIEISISMIQSVLTGLSFCFGYFLGIISFYWGYIDEEHDLFMIVLSPIMLVVTTACIFWVYNIPFPQLIEVVP